MNNARLAADVEGSLTIRAWYAYENGEIVISRIPPEHLDHYECGHLRWSEGLFPVDEDGKLTDRAPLDP